MCAILSVLCKEAGSVDARNAANGFYGKQDLRQQTNLSGSIDRCDGTKRTVENRTAFYDQAFPHRKKRRGLRRYRAVMRAAFLRGKGLCRRMFFFIDPRNAAER